MEKIKFKKTCRICQSKKFVKILDLGAMPPANSFLKGNITKISEEKFPLSIYFCNNCGLLQLRHVVDPEILFKNYLYQTGASSPLVAHFKKLAQEIVRKHLKSKKDLVVEIGSNDGTLLSYLKSRARILGVDPSSSVTRIAEAKGVPTLTEFFNRKTAEKILEMTGPAKVIVANNVMAHIDDLHSVFEGIKILLTKDGRFIFEAHWVGNLIEKGGFDQIYHEHLCYFSLTALSHLVKKFGLKIIDVSLVPIHGESIRVTVGKTGVTAKAAPALLKREKRLELDSIKAYQKFADKVRNNKKLLVKLLLKFKKEGKKIIAYGAPAKGNTLLNYCQINSKILDFITDTTPSKQGLYTPNTKIPIVAREKIDFNRPDYILLLAWNYADAILAKESSLRNAGVKFIIPVPEVKII